MPYCLSGDPIPESLIIVDQRINTVFTVLNLAIPVLEGVAYYLSDTVSLSHPQDNESIQIFVLVTKTLIGLIAINSAGFLGAGLLKIKKRIKQGDATDSIDFGIMALHMASLVLYIVS